MTVSSEHNTFGVWVLCSSHFSVKIRTYLIVESLSHTDSTSREVWIIILSFSQDNSCWGITVASEQGKYIVLKENYYLEKSCLHQKSIKLHGAWPTLWLSILIGP